MVSTVVKYKCSDCEVSWNNINDEDPDCFSCGRPGTRIVIQAGFVMFGRPAAPAETPETAAAETTDAAGSDIPQKQSEPP